MSRWIRGRLGRPLASILSVMMLVSILLPLAPPPVQAQGETSIDWPGLNPDSIKATPTALAVIDFNNKSDHKTGMLGRQISDSLSMALQATGKFNVVPRTETDSAMQDLNLSIPMDFGAQAMLAERLNVPYTISGDIEKVDVHPTKNGTYAEVAVNAFVVSKITRLPINGARVIQRSSPKIGYVGNTNALVYEALSTAAYVISQKIIDNRMPITTVLISNDEKTVRLRGGSMMGMKPGMKMVAIRQGSTSGVLQIVQVSASDSICKVVDDIRGVAPGDKVVPVYDPSPIADTARHKKNTTNQILALAGLGLLAALVTRSSHDNDASTVTAVPLGNAGLDNYAQGANMVSWREMGNPGNNLAYIVYRSDNTREIPIAVVPSTPGLSRYTYIDAASHDFAYYNNEVEIAFEDGDNPWQEHTITESPKTATGIGTIGVERTDDQTVTVDISDTHIYAGQRYSYRVQNVYFTAIPPTTDTTGTTGSLNSKALNVSKAAADTSGLYKIQLGNLSKPTAKSLVIPPPVFVTPSLTIPYDENTADPYTFSCASYTPSGLFGDIATFNYTSVILQVSNEPNFPSGNTANGNPATLVYTAKPGITGVNSWSVDVSNADLRTLDGNGAANNGGFLFVRWGGLGLNGGTPRGRDDLRYCDNYVFSAPMTINFADSNSASVNSITSKRKGMLLPATGNSSTTPSHNRRPRRLLGR